MNSVDTTTPSLLPDPADEQHLKALVLPFTEACPDLHALAHEAAQGILDKHGVKGIDPDQVWWHRFNNTSVSSTKAFLLWEHYPTPSESLTLPQLLVKRFRPHDQDNADLLDGYGGFYNEGPKAAIFNETNEVRMYPSEVLKDLWAINFSELYRKKMERFWTLHSDDFRTLAKLNFLSQALDEHDGSRLNNENLKTVIKAVAGNVTWPISRSMLEAQASVDAQLRVCALDIGGYTATDILCITDRNGVQILYTPGEIDGFHIFASPSDLHWWLLGQNNHAQNRARFMAHFPLAAQQQDDDNVGLNAMIDLLYSTWGRSDHHLINQKAEPITGDAFSWLRDSVKARMASDADLSLHSNGDLREKMWIGYLNAFVRIFGSMAAVGWPVALAAVGAGIASMGLNIDQAINGSTKADRKAGVIGAISSGIETLFNLPFLRGASELAEAAEASETFTLEEDIAEPVLEDASSVAPIAQLAPGPAYAKEGAELLSAFETNEILDGLSPVATEGKFMGIYQPPTGGNYVLINDSYYLVRYVNELKTWVIIDPANPYSFYRNLPIRPDEAGNWQPINRPGLFGGGKFDGLWPWGRASNPLPDVESPPTAYDMPQAIREDLNDIAQGGGTKYDLKDYMQSLPKPDGSNPVADFKAMRKTLYRDATTRLESLTLPARPEIPALPPGLDSKSIIKKLLRSASGLIIGESHSSVASKQFLIENMEVLSKQNVKTLYLEHLLTDFHQVDLDAFNKTGTLSESLEKYLKHLDRGFKTDPSDQFTFLELVKAARKSHIRIQAIDCLASYKSTGMVGVDKTFRQKMMNFFSHEVIRTDQAARGAHRWVALVGDSHANSWEGVPGLSELEGGIGLRIESTPAGTARGIEVDPGRIPTDEFGRPLTMVKSDLRLQLDTPPSVTLAETLETALSNPGDCTVMNIDGQATLIHRSRSGSIVRTTIQRDHGSFYVERANWSSISGQRYPSLVEFSSALRLIGLRPVQVPGT
ncbi:membrane-targeted effector domain-containing toxin [Pseudomonas sp. H3(2019)]|uniref:membrane-targeted effector domain-containing toxin n=1 Tax=Pseudomonas sp. H3(2019) TaxID=2598724 RepID=UPI0011938A5D|nr:membrane-targeted effector domain-containing toxin [Pseudomonas sp. H3(2019)]TVT85262.1 membrane-targeted effector domain-containing toxin [Pseudomonas sp. H3(2019)]